MFYVFFSQHVQVDLVPHIVLHFVLLPSVHDGANDLVQHDLQSCAIGIGCYVHAVE